MSRSDDLRSQIEETNERVFNRGDLDYIDEVYAEDMGITGMFLADSLA